MKLILKYLAIMCLVTLQSCGEGGSDNPLGPQTITTTNTTDQLRIGSGTGTAFVNNSIQLGSATITEGGQTSVRINIVDASGNLANVTGDATFSSSCANNSQATLSATNVNIIGGTANIAYTDVSCPGSDVISAVATLTSGEQLRASASISINKLISLGTGAGTAFQAGKILLGAANITPGGSVSIEVDIVDGNNNPVTDFYIVNFSSFCSADSKAVFTVPSAPTNTGKVSTTYIDQGCGTDFITATITDNGTDIIATGQLKILPLQLGTASGTAFNNGALSISSPTILEGTGTEVSVNIVDFSGALHLSPATVIFSSTCSEAATPSASFTNSRVTTFNGLVKTTYLDSGCPAADTITATLETVSAIDPVAIGNVKISALRIGAVTGTGFTEGALSVSPTNITEGDTTTVSVDIVDSTGALYKSPVSVNFESSCSKATTPTASFASSTITTDTGTATAIYQNSGCPISDTITATLNTVRSLDPTSTGAVTITPLRIGTGSGASFTNGLLELGLSSIGTGGTTSVKASVVDASGALTNKPITVNFESNCVNQGTASFDNSTSSTINGIASVTYTASSGCTGGTDSIRASMDPFGNSIRTATSDISIAAPGVGSIQFSSTDSNIIALKGTGNSTGLSENALLTFTVFDSTGAPAPNVDVTFSLNTTLGGVTLQSNTDISDANGLVQAIIQSGTVSTSVRVTATVNTTSLSTQSTAIVISTGLPDQDSFSLSATTLNPQAWDHDGITSVITARLSDRFNNPIQDGTNINFTTELGSIESSCTTVGGACSVTWTSQSPRVLPQVINNEGRTTIMAHVIGEESFVDDDSDGVYSNGDGSRATGAFTDISEPFVDYNEDGLRGSGSTSEPFKDFDAITSPGFDGPDQKFNGVLCTHSTECSLRETAFVWASIVLVMSEDQPQIIKIRNSSVTLCDNTNAATNDDCYNDGVTTTATAYPGSIKVGSKPETLTFSIVGSTNGQILPVGTVVSFLDSSATTATTLNVIGVSSTEILNTNQNSAIQPSVSEYSLTIQKDTTPGTETAFFPSIVIPKNDAANTGAITTNFPPITIDDRPLFVTIDLPSAFNSTYDAGIEFNLAGTAIDPEDGDISALITWSSNIDGPLGTGKSIAVNGGTPLSVGIHAITASIQDSAGNIAQVTSSISIQQP